MSEKEKVINAFLRKIAKAEGKKHQASIGDIREIFKLMDKELDGQISLLLLLKNLK